MNLLSSIKQYNFPDRKQLAQTIEEVTYDSYEDNNPFSQTFNDIDIEDEDLKNTVVTVKAAGGEAFSAFTNPFYLTHKIIQLPEYYKNAVNLYKNTQKQNKEG